MAKRISATPVRDQLIAHAIAVQDWPISRWHKTGRKRRGSCCPPGEWEFIKVMSRCSMMEAIEEARRLQKENPGFEYRLWDCR